MIKLKQELTTENVTLKYILLDKCKNLDSENGLKLAITEV